MHGLIATPKMPIDFSSREIATLAWTGVILFFVLRSKVLREGLLAIFEVIFCRPIIKWSSFMLIYVGFACYGFHLLGAWSVSEIKPTILWLLSAGLYMVYHVVRERPNPSCLIGGVFRDGFNIAVILEFFVSSYTFSVYVELLLVPVAGFLAFISTPPKTDDPRAAIAVKFANSALSCIGLFILIRAMTMTLLEWSDFWSIQTAHSFLIPIALSLSFLPFLWIVQVHTAYEHSFSRLGVYSNNLDQVWRLKFWMFWEFGFRYYEVWNWWQYYVINKPESYAEIKRSFALSKDFKLESE